jgi:hypothetical protein
MSLRYCSLHQRLFSRRDQRWVPLPHETSDNIRGYDDLLRAIPTDASFLEVLERACDQCQATVRQIAQVTRPLGNRPRARGRLEGSFRLPLPGTSLVGGRRGLRTTWYDHAPTEHPCGALRSAGRSTAVLYGHGWLAAVETGT